MIETMERRRSIRKYKDQGVEEEKLQRILESGRIAPSGSNTQPWHFVVVKSEETRQKLAKVSHDQQWMMTAPVFIACVADVRCRVKPEVPYRVDENSPGEEVKQIIRDTSIAIEHMVLEAEELGLGTCWVAWYTQDEIRPVLGIPEDKYLVAILTVGYADEQPAARPRKKLEEIVHYEKW